LFVRVGLRMSFWFCLLLNYFLNVWNLVGSLSMFQFAVSSTVSPHCVDKSGHAGEPNSIISFYSERNVLEKK
jgi:hypothetical protein